MLSLPRHSCKRLIPANICSSNTINKVPHEPAFLRLSCSRRVTLNRDNRQVTQKFSRHLLTTGKALVGPGQMCNCIARKQALQPITTRQSRRGPSCESISASKIPQLEKKVCAFGSRTLKTLGSLFYVGLAQHYPGPPITCISHLTNPISALFLSLSSILVYYAQMLVGTSHRATRIVCSTSPSLQSNHVLRAIGTNFDFLTPSCLRICLDS